MKKSKLYLSIVLALILMPITSAAQDGEWVLGEGIDGSVHPYISCADSMNAMIAVHARYLNQEIRKTEDGGKSWKIVYSDSGQLGNGLRRRLQSVSYPTPNFAIAQYDSFYVVRTTDGGKTWSRIKFADIKAKSSMFGWHGIISMFDEKYGYLNTAYTFPDRLFGTEDGGLTWVEVSNKFPDKYFGGGIMNLKCMGKGKLICALYSSAASKSGIAVTSDGGVNWQIASEEVFENFAYLDDFSFIDSLNGFAIGANSDTTVNIYYPLLYRTRNGGYSWEEVKREKKYLFKNGGLFTISFMDTLNGIMGGSSDIIRTIDGGKTWVSELDTGYKFNSINWCVSRVNGNKGFAVSTRGSTMSYQSVTKSVGTGAAGFAEEILIYPNPTKDIVNMRFTEQLGSNAELGLFDNIGSKVLSKIISKGAENLQIDVSDLPNGIYKAVIKYGEKNITQKVVVVK